jgi:MSHA biogenesis protein MshI
MSEHGLSHVQCVVTLNPADYRLIYLDAPNVTDEELGGAAKWLVKEFINFPLSNAAVDAFRVPVRAGQPSKMYAVVAQIDRLKSIITACEKATIDVIAIDIAELSLRNLMKVLQEETKEVALLFMRSDFHAVLISHEDTLCFSRNIEAKIPADLSDPASKEEGIHHLVKEIERSIYFYQSNIGSKALEKIWISTELEDEPSFLKLFSESTTLSCEPFDFHRYFNAEKNVKLASVVFSGIALGGLLRQE